MFTAIENIANEMRYRLYSSEFRCLSSFLAALSELSGAKGAGVVSVLGNELFPRRMVGEPYTEIEDELKAELVRNENSKLDPARAESLGEWTSDKKYLLLRRFWPPSSWPQKPGEQFWLYVFDPRLVIAPTLCASSQSTDQFGGIISAFVRWKNEVFMRHEELLSPPLVDPELALKELKKLIVRPVLPRHFFGMLQGLTPKDIKPVEWAKRIQDLLLICKRPTQCRCAVVSGTELEFQCPQTNSIDDALNVLADLDVWRTDFWKASRPNGVMPSIREQLDEQGVAGLKNATRLLRVQPNWLRESQSRPLDFANGALGLSGERLLLRHFCLHGIEMAFTRLESTWRDAKTHSSLLEFPARLASLASTLIGDGHWTPEAIENLLQVVALFGHQVLDVPARIDLVRHLRQTLRGETALHTLKSRYRDHFFHTLEVCFLGFALLKSRPKSDSDTSLAEQIVFQCHEQALARGEASGKLEPNEVAKRVNELFSQWWVAALIHDTAYGIDIFDATLKLLDYFSNNKEVKDFTESSRKAAAQMADPPKLKELAPELEFDPTLRKGDHGVIAAASLNKTLERIGSETRKKFRPSVRAIAFHNTRFPKVDAGRDPIAALLILCDTVQEWGRSSLGFDHSPSVLLSRMMEASLTPPEEQFGPVKRYALSMKPVEREDSLFSWLTEDKLVIELDYGPASLKECRAKFTWADFTYNLQRVDFRPWGLDLRIHVSVPSPDETKSQFEYFGDFIEEQEVRFAERWFHIAAQRSPNKAVCYRSDKNVDGNREIIEFNLNELSREFCDETPLMGGSVSDFGKAIEKWSVYVREQTNSTPAQSSPV